MGNTSSGRKSRNNDKIHTYHTAPTKKNKQNIYQKLIVKPFFARMNVIRLDTYTLFVTKLFNSFFELENTAVRLLL